jgi:hypothetical protein
MKIIGFPLRNRNDLEKIKITFDSLNKIISKKERKIIIGSMLEKFGLSQRTSEWKALRALTIMIRVSENAITMIEKNIGIHSEVIINCPEGSSMGKVKTITNDYYIQVREYSSGLVKRYSPNNLTVCG